MAEKQDGFGLIWRRFQRHRFWTEKRVFNRAEAWLDCWLFLAAFEAHTRVIAGKTIPLERGQFIASDRFLEKRWGWSRGRVRRFIEDCIENGELRRVASVNGGCSTRDNAGGTVYLVVKYDDCQMRGTTDGTSGGPLAVPLTDQRETSKPKKKNTKKKADADSVREVFEYWQQKLNKPRMSLTDQRRTVIRARLNDGFTVDALKEAIDGVAMSPFHAGAYDDLTSIFRNATRVEQHRERALHGAPAPDALVDDVLALLLAAGDMVFFVEGRRHALQEAMEKHPDRWARAGPVMGEMNYALIKSRQANGKDYRDAIAGEIRRIQEARRTG